MRSRTRPSLVRRARRWLLWLLALMLVAAALGALYHGHAGRRDAERFPAPGRMVDVGGHRLHLHCAGQGSPTVWLEAGLGNDVSHWSRVFEALAARHRTCAYDRAGLGWSEAGPLPRSAAQVVDEALRLQAASGESPPYLLVGHSNGAAYVRLQAVARPDEVAGLLLVDPSVSHPDACPQLSGAARALFGGVVALAPTGLPRALLPVLFPLERSALPAEAREAHAAQRARTRALQALWSEAGESCAMQAAADAAGWAPGVPVEVLIAERRPAQQGWVPAATQALATAAGAPLLSVADSGHWIQLDAPQALLDAVDRISQRARAADAGVPQEAAEPEAPGAPTDAAAMP